MYVYMQVDGIYWHHVCIEWRKARPFQTSVVNLIPACSNAHDMCPQHGLTPLMKAAGLGHLPVVNAFLKAGVDVNAANHVCVYASV